MNILGLEEGTPADSDVNAANGARGALRGTGTVIGGTGEVIGGTGEVLGGTGERDGEDSWESASSNSDWLPSDQRNVRLCYI